VGALNILPLHIREVINMNFCNCIRPLPPRLAMRDILDEMKEFVQEPSKDEMSDVLWGVGRLIGGILGRSYVRIPGDADHYKKVVVRMDAYGCVRSRRHLKHGVCPSEG
jgi:hypothetical protein